MAEVRDEVGAIQLFEADASAEDDVFLLEADVFIPKDGALPPLTRLSPVNHANPRNPDTVLEYPPLKVNGEQIEYVKTFK